MYRKEDFKKLTRAVVLLLSTMLSSRCAPNEYAPLATVPAVDLERYAGIWYEISALPQRFEEGCHCVSAEYRINPKGYVDVLNACRKDGPSGEVEEAEGKAFPVEGSNDSKLKVQFFWPFKGDYWILELDPAYRYVMVGSPDRESLWFLSRAPTLDKATVTRLEELARGKGFAVENMRPMDQSCNE